MASRSHAALRQIHRVFDQGTLVGLSEGQLLERFATRSRRGGLRADRREERADGPGRLPAILHHSHDIEDAFQATFLILVRKAGSLKDRDLLGHWLHGVAYRVAVRARACAAGGGLWKMPRRRTSVSWRTLVAKPTGAIPARPRCRGQSAARAVPTPVILCLIEDRTVTRRRWRAPGWPVGTVRVRLARGRERLRARLTRLGLAPSAALLGFVLAPIRSRRWSPALAHATLQAARRIATGRAAIGAASTTSAATLARGVLRSLAMARLKGAPLYLLAVVIAAIGAAGLVRGTPGSEPAIASTRPRR